MGGGQFFYITLTYKKDTILFISISVISLSYQSFLSLFIYTYLYVTIFKLLIFGLAKYCSHSRNRVLALEAQ